MPTAGEVQHHRCPTTPGAGPRGHLYSGCGQVFEGAYDAEGMVTCPQCDLRFDPANAANRWDIMDRLHDAKTRLEPLLSHNEDRVWRSVSEAHEALTSGSAIITDQRDALKAAEAFIAGFEGDEMQEGVDALLKRVRDAIEGVS